MRCVSIKITGQVQGVSFRESARAMALELGVTGMIRNEADGSVYAEAEGEDAVVEKFVEWCREGSSYATVENIEVKRLPLRDFDGFTVQR